MADAATVDLAALAQQWVDGGQPPPAGLLADTHTATALAWALKALCYAAWSSDPPAARRAADALALLDAAAPGNPVITALVHWTRAIAALTSGRMEEAVASLDSACQLLLAQGHAAEAAQTRVPRIMALAMLGRHAEAVATAEDAQQRFVALGDRRSAAKTSLNLGSLQLRHDAYAEAARHYREASALFARIEDREHSVMADIGTGDALAALGDVDEAARIYARARMRAATHGLPVLQALVDESTALLDLSSGRYGDALAGFENARRRYAALQMPQHLAIAEKQLADAYLELRLLPEALALYAPALQHMHSLQMPEDAAWTLTQRGRALALSGDTAGADTAFAEAAAAFAQQDSAVGSAAVLLARAELALARHDDAAALQAALAAAAGFDAADLPGAGLRAQIVAAQARLRQGMAAGPDFQRLLLQAQAAQMLSAQVHCWVGLGDAALAADDRTAARRAYQQAIQRFEQQRSALPGDDVRIAFLADHLRPYQALLQLAVQDHAAAPTQQHAAEVLRWLDRVRARTLGERLVHGPGPAQTDSDAVAGLRTRLSWLTRRLQRQQDDGEPSAALEAQRRQLELELLETARRERLARGPSWRRTVDGDLIHTRSDNPGRQHGDNPDDTADDLVTTLRQRLQPGDALVEWGVCDGQLLACVVRSDGVWLQAALAPVADVELALQAVRFQIEALRHGAGRLTAHLPRLAARAQVHLQRLHGLLWAPLLPLLQGARRVLLVAPASLGGVPFAALHDGQASLGTQHQLALAPSAAWACEALARQPRRPQRALVLGESSRLQHTDAETTAVAACFDQPLLLRGADATVQALQQHAAQADVLHLACHAEFRQDNPLFSALHLADAPLTAERVEALALPPGMAVLSACDTALAGASGAVDGALSGDEHIGLVRAFFVAGAARVVASLWPVDDAVTAQWMTVFYAALQAGADPAAALQTAQAAVRTDHPHPYFWAAFALYGGW